MHGYYGPNDHAIVRPSEMYMDMHPSFAGLSYRDHMPLTQAERQLLREE